MMWRKGPKLNWLQAFLFDRPIWWLLYGIIIGVDLFMGTAAVARSEMSEALPALVGIPAVVLGMHILHASWQAFTPAVGGGTAADLAEKSAAVISDIRHRASLLTGEEGVKVLRYAEGVHRSLIKELVKLEKEREQGVEYGRANQALFERFNSKIELLEAADQELRDLVEERDRRAREWAAQRHDSTQTIEEQRGLEAALENLREVRVVEKRSWEELKGAAGLK